MDDFFYEHIGANAKTTPSEAYDFGSDCGGEFDEEIGEEILPEVPFVSTISDIDRQLSEPLPEGAPDPLMHNGTYQVNPANPLIGPGME